MSKGEQADTDSVAVFDASFDVSKEVVHSFDEIRVPAIGIWNMHHNKMAVRSIHASHSRARGVGRTHTFDRFMPPVCQCIKCAVDA